MHSLSEQLMKLLLKMVDVRNFTTKYKVFLNRKIKVLLLPEVQL